MCRTAKDNPSQWLAWWKQVLRDVISDPASKARVMVDLLNEPDSHGLGYTIPLNFCMLLLSMLCMLGST